MTFISEFIELHQGFVGFILILLYIFNIIFIPWCLYQAHKDRIEQNNHFSKVMRTAYPEKNIPLAQKPKTIKKPEPLSVKIIDKDFYS